MQLLLDFKQDCIDDKCLRNTPMSHRNAAVDKMDDSDIGDPRKIAMAVVDEHLLCILRFLADEIPVSVRSNNTSTVVSRGLRNAREGGNTGMAASFWVDVEQDDTGRVTGVSPGHHLGQSHSFELGTGRPAPAELLINFAKEPALGTISTVTYGNNTARVDNMQGVLSGSPQTRISDVAFTTTQLNGVDQMDRFQP
jgi:hypothetical protein